jgi:N-acylneuraminate cytidylyltransferase
MNVVAVIPARGGSKSIPKKNINNLCGFPLISYSICSARDAEFINRVVVSTDDFEISEISKEYGAEVVMRPSQFATDISRDHELLNDVGLQLNLMDEDLIVFLRPTHPIRNPKTLQKAFNLYLEGKENFDSLRSMKPSTELVFKTWCITESGKIISAFNPELTEIVDPSNAPRQILPKTYYQDGYIEIFPLKTVKKFANTLGMKFIPFLIEEFSKDIDYLNELTEIEDYLKKNRIPSWFKFPSKK